jgi:Flp pilus assembly protein TadD
MAKPLHRNLCPEGKLAEIVDEVRETRAGRAPTLEAALIEFPFDARLHFLKGSLLAGQGNFADAQMRMRRAIEIDPGYALARFQLGFLLLTCGQPRDAEETWKPLMALAEQNHLRLFATGLTHLIRDEFAATIRLLEQGIAANKDNASMNNDMQLIVDKARQKLS